GTPIGNATEGGGLASAYDGNTSQIWDDSPVLHATAVYNGKRFATAYLISGIKIWLSSDYGLSNDDDTSYLCTVYGKNGSDPASPTDGTSVKSFTIGDTASANFQQLTGFDLDVAYDRIWVTVTAPQPTDLGVFTEIQWFRNV